MKKLLLLIVLLPVLSVGLHSNPQTEEIGEKFDKRQRFEWINEMRGGNDGINWQLLDETTIKSNHLYMMKNIHKYETLQNASSVIADGAITGRWVEKGSVNNSGRIRCIDIEYDKNLIYAASDGGNIFRGTLEGENWTCLNNSQRFYNIQEIKVLYIGNTKRILVATHSNGRIYYTDNEGGTWEQSSGLDAIHKWGNLKRVVFANDDDNTIYLLGVQWNYSTSKQDAVIYYSDDKGSNFIIIYQEVGTTKKKDLWAQPYEGNKVFWFKNDSIMTLQKENIIFYKTFTAVNDTLLKLGGYIADYDVKGAEYDGTIEFAISARTNLNPTSKFFTSEDNGDTWNYNGGLHKTKFMTNSFGTSSFTVSYMYLGKVDLWKSESSGADWSTINGWAEYYRAPETKLHADITAVQFFRINEDEELMYISTDGGLYVSDDYGYSVKNISMHGLNVSQYYSVMTAEIDTNIIYVGAQDQGFQKCTTDSGNVLGFDQLFSGDYGSITSSDGGSTLWSVYPYFVLYLPNAPTAGKWPFFARWSYPTGGWQWMNPTVSVPSNPTVSYAVGPANLYRFEYTNATIVATELSKYTGGGKLTDLTITKNKNIYCTSNDDYLYKTKDGMEWERFKIYDSQGSTKFYSKTVIVSDDEQVIYVSGRGYSTPGAFVSYDGGHNWAAIIEGLPKTMINRLTISDDGKLLFAATPVGPYVYVTWLNRWFSMNTPNSPSQDFRWVEYVPTSKIARFATYGRGIWDFKIESIDTDVKDNSKAIAYDLLIYPNPITTDATISLNMKKTAHISIKVYDMNGNEWACPYDGIMAEGQNTIDWNALSYGNVKLESGAYLIVVSSEGLTQWEKIIIK